MKKTLVIISGPSGVGKTTLIDILVKKYNFIDKVVTCTTRSPRDLEQNGVDYYFLSVDTANKMISNGDFIEHKTIYGNIYGCSSGA
ncbi:MAG: guanylate kinase, partial [Chlamydiia bacterium]|nr:guanylate kinase [Chlamydiia bacterium]